MITKTISRLFVSAALLVTVLAASPVPALAMQINSGASSITAKVDDHGGRRNATTKSGRKNKGSKHTEVETHKSGSQHVETETELEHSGSSHP